MATKKKELEQLQELKPQPLPKLAPRGIRSFTVFRESDETGISGEGKVDIPPVVVLGPHSLDPGAV